MVVINRELESLVTTFTTTDQYRKIEEIFDAFGGKFRVEKREDGAYQVFTDEIGLDMYNILIYFSSIAFII